MNKITQIKVSYNVRGWEKRMLDKWGKYGLKPYYDINLPCFFFGVHGKDDIKNIKNHKGTKIVFFTSSKNSKIINNYIEKLKNTENLIIIDDPYIKKKYSNIIFKKVSIDIKDYSLFKPNILGNKIYSYIPRSRGEKIIKYETDKLKELQKHLNHEIIIGGINKISIEQTKEKYYDNCFINLNLCQYGGGGLTTIRELGFMGRMSIMNTKHNYNSIIPYENNNDIINIINNESKKIGTIQPSIEYSKRIDEQWLDIDFWLK